MKHEKTRDTLVVFLEGELDHNSARAVKRDMDRLLQDMHIRRLIVDMSAMPFMDSSGIGVLLGRYRQVASRGGSVTVRGMSPQVKRIFQLSGMGQIMEVMEK